MPVPQKHPDHHLWMPYCQMKTARQPLDVVATQGVELILGNGNRLVDGISSWWTACHGYNPPSILDAISKQAQLMPHVMLGGIVHPQAKKLSNRLARLLPGQNNKVFLCDSGSVAVEVAMKMAVQHWMNSGTSGKNRFVCFRDSYHGDTAGAMSVCDPEDSMHSYFKGYLMEQFPQPIPETDLEFEQFEKFLIEHLAVTAGVILEPIAQMAAGMRFHSFESVAKISRICRKLGVLFIADEVATGFGRTGPMFAHQSTQDSTHSALVDIMCIGKALTGGTVGMAAAIATEAVYSSFHSDDWSRALMHGPTFMGNPIACAAANASLDLFESEPRLAQVKQIENSLHILKDSLVDQIGIVDVRVRGAIGAVQFEKSVAVDQAVDFFVEKGVWLRPLRDVVYIAPSFTISEQQLRKLCDAVIDFAKRP